MSAKITPPSVKRAAEDIGTQLAAWRKIQDLTAQQVAERANVSRDTLRRLEHGEVGVSLETVLGVGPVPAGTASGTPVGQLEVHVDLDGSRCVLASRA